MLSIAAVIATHNRPELLAERALASRGERPPPEHALYEGISEGGVLHALAARLAAHGGAE